MTSGHLERGNAGSSITLRLTNSIRFGPPVIIRCYSSVASCIVHLLKAFLLWNISRCVSLMWPSYCPCLSHWKEKIIQTDKEQTNTQPIAGCIYMTVELARAFRFSLELRLLPDFTTLWDVVCCEAYVWVGFFTSLWRKFNLPLSEKWNTYCSTWKCNACSRACLYCWYAVLCTVQEMSHFEFELYNYKYGCQGPFPGSSSCGFNRNSIEVCFFPSSDQQYAITEKLHMINFYRSWSCYRIPARISVTMKSKRRLQPEEESRDERANKYSRHCSIGKEMAKVY